MLSAQTKDAVTHAASLRLFRVARTPASIAALSASRIERLIYPVSFYRNKASTCGPRAGRSSTRFDGRVPNRMEELLTLPASAARPPISC
jgi:endonuclease III